MIDLPSLLSDLSDGGSTCYDMYMQQIVESRKTAYMIGTSASKEEIIEWEERIKKT